MAKGWTPKAQQLSHLVSVCYKMTSGQPCRRRVRLDTPPEAQVCPAGHARLLPSHWNQDRSEAHGCSLPLVDEAFGIGPLLERLPGRGTQTFPRVGMFTPYHSSHFGSGSIGPIPATREERSRTKEGI